MAELGERKAREQELRAAEPVHEDYPEYFDDDDLLSTQHIPPRDGFVQRWVRTSMRGQDDQSNVFKKMNKGWRPRLLSTVPKGQYVMKQDFNGSEVIGIHGMILMERPKALHERQAQTVRQQTQMQMQSVKHNLLKEHDPKSGLGSPEMKLRSETTTGRPPELDD